MAEEFQEKLAANKLAEARANFAGYVQSVAFSMTLSRNMVDGLYAIRELGCIGAAGEQGLVSHTVGRHFAPISGSLIRRGLVWHDYLPPSKAEPGHRHFKLTRAGELMCELLVEAGLMAPAREQPRRESA